MGRPLRDAPVFCCRPWQQLPGARKFALWWMPATHSIRNPPRSREWIFRSCCGCGASMVPGITDSANKKAASLSETSNLERALRVADLLLQSGGFGLVALDFSDVPFAAVRRIPLTTWFRFRRAVEHTPTVLLIVAQAPCTQTCASLLVRLQASAVRLRPLKNQLSDLGSQFSAQTNLPAHTQLLQGLQVQGEVQRSRLERKPAQSVTTAFMTKTG